MWSNLIFNSLIPISPESYIYIFSALPYLDENLLMEQPGVFLVTPGAQTRIPIR